jgi:hypothetical protein
MFGQFSVDKALSGSFGRPPTQITEGELPQCQGALSRHYSQRSFAVFSQHVIPFFDYLFVI